MSKVSSTVRDISNEVHEIPVEVTTSDIDELGHVNNVVYLRWVQDAAVSHWRSATSSDEQATVLWVVIRHEIDYKRPARLGDEVVVRTWVGEAKEASFERFTNIVRKADGVVLAKALTLWCPINARTGRIVRIPEDLRKRFSASKREGLAGSSNGKVDESLRHA